MGKRRRPPARRSRRTSTGIRHAVGKVILVTVMLFLGYIGLALIRSRNLGGGAIVATLMLALAALAYFSASRKRGGSSQRSRPGPRRDR
jgi:hypothetical protein